MKNRKTRTWSFWLILVLVIAITSCNIRIQSNATNIASRKKHKTTSSSTVRISSSRKNAKTLKQPDKTKTGRLSYKIRQIKNRLLKSKGKELMAMKNKKLLVILMSACLIATTGGCGNNTTATNDKDKNVKVETEVTSQSDRQDVANEEVITNDTTDSADSVTTEATDVQEKASATEADTKAETSDQKEITVSDKDTSGKKEATTSKNTTTTDKNTSSTTTKNTDDKTTTMNKNTASSDKADTHTHKWKAVYKTVNHKEEGHYETQVIDGDWYEYIKEYQTLCNKCGLNMTDLSDEELTWHCAKVCHSGYHSEMVVVDKIYHPAETKKVWIVDKEAYTEKVLTGYACSCGATKKK